MKPKVALLSLLLTCAIAHGEAAAPKPIVEFVYIGSSGCGFCGRDDYKKRIAAMHAAARRWADEHRFGFQSIGVATDEGREKGESFLANCGVGPFDIRVTGRGWAGAEPYVRPYKNPNPMFADGVPVEGEPQVVVRLRSLEGDTPRDAMRAVGSLIMMIGERPEVEMGLDRATTSTAPQPPSGSSGQR